MFILSFKIKHVLRNNKIQAYKISISTVLFNQLQKPWHFSLLSDNRSWWNNAHIHENHVTQSPAEVMITTELIFMTTSIHLYHFYMVLQSRIKIIIKKIDIVFRICISFFTSVALWFQHHRLNSSMSLSKCLSLIFCGLYFLSVYFPQTGYFHVIVHFQWIKLSSDKLKWTKRSQLKVT